MVVVHIVLRGAVGEVEVTHRHIVVLVNHGHVARSAKREAASDACQVDCLHAVVGVGGGMSGCFGGIATLPFQSNTSIYAGCGDVHLIYEEAFGGCDGERRMHFVVCLEHVAVDLG